MNPNNAFFYTILDKSAPALAAMAATELIEQVPEARQGFGSNPIAGWRDWLTLRVEELAAAVAADRSSLFVSQVHWARAVLAARGFETEHFRFGLEKLRTVLARELPEQVRLLADAYFETALAAFDHPPTEVSTHLLPDTPSGLLASTYLLAVLEGDRRRASELILNAVREGRSVASVYMEVLMPAQLEIGRMWLANEINVAEEHFTSSTTKRLMAQLMQHAEIRPANGKTLLAAAVVGNHHDIGLQMVADFFEMEGWRVVNLGANVPVPDLIQAIDFFKVDVLGLSAARNTELQNLKQTIAAIRKSPRGPHLKILAGGAAFAGSSDLAAELGADGFGENAPAAVGIGNRLVGLDRPSV